MEITINLPEWIAYIGVALIMIWSINNALLLVKRFLEWRIRKLKDKKQVK